jgi:osmotically-inducible protein OsmY
MTMTRHLTDHQLKYELQRELDWTAEVDSDHVGISVNEGAVTLSGQVGTFPEKAAAVRAALRVRGVAAIADEIVVHHRYGPREDADIARDATTAVAGSVTLPAGSVRATVRGHEVTLTGTVAWQYQRTAASQAVATIPGVIAVHNSITLSPPAPMVGSDDARANVNAALQRNAALEAQHVEVSVNGTEIRLSGHVATWAERHAAEYAAWCTPGVTHVDDRITVIS